MPTLAEVTSETRTILKWGGLVLGLLIIGFIAFRIYSAFFAPEPAPTVTFGKLEFQFPTNQVSNSLSYALDTVTGDLPSLPTQTKVYVIEKKEPDLLSLARATDRVATAGFSTKPAFLSDSVYQWPDEGPPARTLTMNIFTNNFNMLSSYLSDSEFLTFDTTDSNSAVLAARSFLEGLNLLPEDLSAEKTKTILFSINNFSLIPATSISNAQVIQVNLFQNDINGMAIYYSHPATSPMNFLVAEIGRETMVVEANFTHRNVLDISSTYPLKTAGEAFLDLKNNNTYISTYTGTQENILIKNVSLGYFIGDKEQNHLVPVVVFEGNNFQAFVLAVKDEWVNK